MRGTKYRFPWRPDNDFELLIDGVVFFPRMLGAIDAAREYILLEMYLFESGRLADRFIEALTGAARRGVRVLLLLDDFGARRLSRRDRQRLASADIELAFYNPLRYGELRRNLFRDHRKLLLVDGQVGFIGGAGITDAFDGLDQPTHAWRETMVQIRGPVLADWQALFAEVWDRLHAQPLDVLPRTPEPIAEGPLGRVSYSGGLKAQEVKRAAIKWIRGAEHRAWVATAYFIPSWKIRRALRRAARQGADVRLLLPGPYTDHPGVRQAGRRFYTRLLRNGVRIFEYQPRFLHQKVLLCDQHVSIGSTNLDRWNLRWNLEANQDVDDQDFAERVQTMLEEDFEHSREILFQQWRYRPWHRRLLEWFFGKVDLYLEGIGRRRSSKRHRRGTKRHH